MIYTALAFVAAVGGIGADISLVKLSAEARTVRTRTQLTDADFVRMRLLRTNGRIAIAVANCEAEDSVSIDSSG